MKENQDQGKRFNMLQNKEEQQYLDLLKRLIDADSKDDRTGVGTHSIFGHQIRFSLEDDTLPLLTTKKVFFRGAVEELLFFIRGERDTKKLEEKGINIWKGNTSKEFLEKRGLNYKEGDMGPMYGVQLRHFCQGFAEDLCNYVIIQDGRDPDFGNETMNGIDQLQYVINEIKNNPTSRRILMTTFNPIEVDGGVLWPCHGIVIQFNVRNDKLDCLFYMRSVDSLLGLPFNIVSYALLTHIIAKATNLKPGDLIFSGGDVHLYKNHIKQANLQITRDPYNFPKIKINKEINSIQDMENLCYEDFELIGYQHHPAIKAEMAI